MGGFHVFGNVVLLTAAGASPPGSSTAPRADLGRADAAGRGGVSRLPNDAGLIFKVLGPETEPVRAAVRAFCVAAREEVTGRTFPPAFSWR